MSKSCMELTGNEHMIATKYLVFPVAELLSPKDNKNSAAPNNDMTYKDDIFSIIISLKISSFLMILGHKIGFLHIL